LRYLAESSFWVYIIHVPIVALVQIVLLPYRWPIAIKFLVISVTSVSLSLLSYEYLVRRSLIGEIINGTRKRSRKRSWISPEFGWAATVVLIVTLGAGCTWWLRPFFFGENLHAVVPGQVYRSARLKPERLAQQIQAHGLRSVIVFTTDATKNPSLIAQSRLCATHNVKFITIPFPSLRAPTRRSLMSLVRSIDEAPRPLLFQGQRGIRSVSLASALALLLDGTSPDDALRQFAMRYGEFSDIDRSALASAVLEYRNWLAAEHKPHSAVEFREWAVQCSTQTVPADVPTRNGPRAQALADDRDDGRFVR
jgi:hypothetical protein